MGRLVCTVVILSACMQWAVGAETDTAYVERYSLWRQTYEQALQNPAMMTQAYMKSHTELSVKCDYRHQGESYRLEEGTGFVMPEIKADTYIRLTGSSVVWGEASYSNGKHYDKVYNNVADFDLLYPDVIADSIGGDTHRERYYFAGGYAAEMGKWRLGGVLKLRAEQEYRTYDPRMRSVVYDVLLSAGAARSIGGYVLGLQADGNIYRQTADVDFYSELNGMGELQMTGLGTHYVRFSGSNRDIFYHGKGGILSLDLQPSGNSGWQARLSHGIHLYERLSDEYNSMPLTTLYRQQTALTVGWRKQSQRSEKALLVHALYDRRASDEHVAGTASGQEYPILTDLTMYHEHHIDAGITALYGRGDWHWMLKGGYMSNRERYEYVERKVEYSRLYGELTAQWLKKVRQNLWLNWFAKAGYEGCISERIVMPYANMSSGIRNYINHNWKYQRAGYTQLGTGLRADYRPQRWRVGLFAQVAAALRLCSAGRQEINLQVSAGVTI